jgi:hypothetical protein
METPRRSLRLTPGRSIRRVYPQLTPSRRLSTFPPPSVSFLGTTPKTSVVIEVHDPETSAIEIVSTIRIREPQKPRKHRSWVWFHGKHVEAFVKKQKAKTFSWEEKWQCNDHPDVLYSPGTTSHIHQHLRQVHGKVPPVDVHISPNDPSNSSPAQQQSSTIDTKIMRPRMVAWFAKNHIPYLQAESKEFRLFMSSFNEHAVDALPMADSLKNYTMKFFKEKRTELGTFLSEMDSKIHISFDGWTSPNYCSFIGVVGYYVDPDGSFTRLLLGLPELNIKHTGENMAKCILDSLEKVGLLQDKTGFYILDNAKNNDRALDFMNITDDKDTSRRLRCLGHILDLVVKELFADSDSAKDSPISKWKRHLALRKLHYLSKLIRTSPTRKAAYLALLEEMAEFVKMIESYQSTRWSSIDKMIVSALPYKEELDRFVDEAIEDTTDAAVRQKLESSRLNADDWYQLGELHRILKPFHDITTRLQG